MLIVPELKTVFILVPRTGTGTLYREMLRVYPRAMLLYRHMEADGCPQGYDRWRRIGFVRHPLYRLHSLYKFMQTFDGGNAVPNEDSDKRRIHRQVAGRTFEEWLLNNNEPWTVPFDLNGEGKYWPILSRRNPAPENRISQFAYLRPDLGTEVRHFETLRSSLREFDLDADTVKNSSAKQPLEIGARGLVEQHLERYCAWDLNQMCIRL
jgi:hypothetical protein